MVTAKSCCVTEGLHTRDVSSVCRKPQHYGRSCNMQNSNPWLHYENFIACRDFSKKYAQELLLEQFRCRYYRCSVIFI